MSKIWQLHIQSKDTCTGDVYRIYSILNTFWHFWQVGTVGTITKIGVLKGTVLREMLHFCPSLFFALPKTKAMIGGLSGHRKTGADDRLSPKAGVACTLSQLYRQYAQSDPPAENWSMRLGMSGIVLFTLT